MGIVRKRQKVQTAILAVLCAFQLECGSECGGVAMIGKGRVIALPSPKLKGAVSVEEALASRRSHRVFADAALSIGEVSQLLWAAQGVTAEGELRTAPSAGALYPLEVYVAAGRVRDLAAGVYRYLPRSHSIEMVKEGDVRYDLALASLGQKCVADAPAVIAIAAVYRRTEPRYKERAERYVHIEAGHAAQNVYLQCESLNLGTVAVGAFSDSEVGRVLSLQAGEEALYLFPDWKKIERFLAGLQ